MKIGVVGCGQISDIYLQNMLNRFHLDVKSCAASVLSHAEVKAREYGILAATVEEMMQDPEIGLIVNLTPPSAHEEITRKAFLAGKHVYTEKPLTETLTQAEALLLLAKEKNLYYGCAPETFLGKAAATAKAMIDSGKLGEITGFHATINLNIDEMYDKFSILLEPAGGIGLDRGIYFLTQLCYLLGYAEEAHGFAVTRNPDRVVNGKAVCVPGENQMVAALRMKSGVLGTVNFNGNTIFPEFSHLEIYGKKGILKLPDANLFGGPVQFLHSPDGSAYAEWETLPEEQTSSPNLRGIGVSKMAEAIQNNTPNPIDAALGYHVMQIISWIKDDVI